MRRYVFTARAMDDLSEIDRYTRREWELGRARRYWQELELALQRLNLAPSIGRYRDDLAPRLQSFRVASHIAFFLTDRDSITIVRLLHPSMDVERSLSQVSDIDDRDR